MALGGGHTNMGPRSMDCYVREPIETSLHGLIWGTGAPVAAKDSRPPWLRRVSRHPFVVTLAALVVVVSGVGVVLDLPGKVRAAWTAVFGSDDSRPDLSVDKVEVVSAASIDAVETGPDSSTSKISISGSAIDITLRNAGTAPALIVDARASFKSAVQLENCSGAGPGVASAQYDLRVPTDANTTSHPFTVRRDMRFIVQPNSIDRFRLTVGPAPFGDSEWPWIYQMDLLLVEDSGQTLPVGKFELAGYVGESWNRFSGVTATDASYDPACYLHDSELLSAATSSPGLHAPELTTLNDEAKSLAAAVRSCGRAGASQGPCSEEVGRYFSDPRGVRRCSDSLEVVQSYDCTVAENVRTAYGQNGLKDMSVTISSGFLILPMVCSPAGSAEVCRSADNQDLVVGFMP
jgi:hypothetical protein